MTLTAILLEMGFVERTSGPSTEHMPSVFITLEFSMACMVIVQGWVLANTRKKRSRSLLFGSRQRLFPFHNFNLVGGEVVEGVDVAVDGGFEGGDVGGGVGGSGGEDAVHEVGDGRLLLGGCRRDRKLGYIHRLEFVKSSLPTRRSLLDKPI